MNESELVSVITNLLDNLKGTQQRQPGQFTTGEIREHLNCGEDKAREICRRLFKDGKLKPVMVSVESLWGGRHLVRGWELVR